MAFFPAALYTDRPSFCISCHDMRPFYDAWRQSRHGDVSCIGCHVAPGYANRFLHKFVALQEVYAQFFTRPTFPNHNAEVPDARCLRCHADVPAQQSTPGGRFSHEIHGGKRFRCAQCHQDTGHRVSFAALAAASVLNTVAASGAGRYVGEIATSTADKASELPRHVRVVCSRCHDMVKAQCGFCHPAPPNHFGADCRLCHPPYRAFADFVHPPSGEHPFNSRPCVTCHPNGYTTVYCTCHRGRPPTDD